MTSTEAPSTLPSKLAPCEESCEDLVQDCEDVDDCNEALTCATNQWEVDTQSCDQRKFGMVMAAPELRGCRRE